MPEDQRVGVDVKTEIHRRVIDGRIRPGQRLVEQRLAEELDVSRTPVREALAALQAQGHVVRTGGGGWQTVRYSLDELRDAFEVRGVLESFAAYEAALKAAPHEVEAVREAYEVMHRATMTLRDDRLSYAKEMVIHNAEFHSQVVAAGHNLRLAHAMRAVTVVPLVFSAFAWYTPEQRETSDRLHALILEAIDQRDPRRAERIMAEHIAHGRDVVIEHLREQEFGHEMAPMSDIWQRLADR